MNPVDMLIYPLVFHDFSCFLLFSSVFANRILPVPPYPEEHFLVTLPQTIPREHAVQITRQSGPFKKFC